MSVFFLLMKYIFILIILFSNTLKAQKYVTDQIIIDSVTYPYRFHHLEQYFKTYPEKRPVVNSDTTVINRNYVAIFKIEKDKIILNDLKIKLKKEANEYTETVLNNVFPTKADKQLNWISGLFYVGIGKPLEKQTDTLHIDYSDYIVFEIKKGTILRKDLFTHKQMNVFKNYQYERFSKTKEFKRLETTLKERYKMTDWELDTYIRRNIIYLSKKNYLKQ